MVEKPIIFSTPMVQAILDGRKTQTRRPIKPQPHMWNMRWNGEQWEMYRGYPIGHIPASELCPWQPGDKLWVREMWAVGPPFYDELHHECNDIFYRTDDTNKYPDDGPWRSPRYMPKRAARIWLEVTDARVERLQEITNGDALKEGFCKTNVLAGETRFTWFVKTWNSIHIKAKEYQWDNNPWVWVIEFRRI